MDTECQTEPNLGEPGDLHEHFEYVVAVSQSSLLPVFESRAHVIRGFRAQLSNYRVRRGFQIKISGRGAAFISHYTRKGRFPLPLVNSQLFYDVFLRQHCR